MIEAKFTIEESHNQFLEHHQAFGFKDKSEIVRQALDLFYAQLMQQQLEESAKLYEEVYAEDKTLETWVKAKIAAWPE